MEMVLSDNELKDFIDYGYVAVKNAFSRDIANKCKEKIWERIENDEKLNIQRNNQLSWPYDKLPIGEVYWMHDGYPWNEVFTQRLQIALNQIAGNENLQDFGLGWWTITFPMNPIYRDTEKWKVSGSIHIDGSNKKYPYSKDIGCTLIMYFNDVLSNAGGTCAYEGSHKIALQALVNAGLRGATSKELQNSVIASNQEFNLIEFTGEAGDVIIIHPLLLHGRGMNLGTYDDNGVRFMCHPTIALKQHLNYFNKNIDDMTILEKSIYLNIQEFSNDSIHTDQEDVINDDHIVKKVKSSHNYLLKTLLEITPEAVNEFENQRKTQEIDDNSNEE